MRTLQEIETKLAELKKLYSKFSCEEKPESEECKSILTQIQFLEWGLKMRYYKTE
jgi:hypothetical protein